MMTHIGRIDANITCEIIFTPQEWQCVYSKVDQRQLLLRLGGFLARKGDGSSGSKTI